MVKQNEISDKDKNVEDDLNKNFSNMTELLRNLKPGEEIVISGISGTFPNAENVHEFRENLFNKFQMPVESRWTNFTHPELPKRTGIIPNTERYDAGYFGFPNKKVCVLRVNSQQNNFYPFLKTRICTTLRDKDVYLEPCQIDEMTYARSSFYRGVHARQANKSDAKGRILQQKTVEAIMDAGLHPSDLENTNTGVYVGACVNENEKTVFIEELVPNSYAWTGHVRSMESHRLSYFLKLRGPSTTVDTACSSSIYALEHAFRALMLGEIDNAIVAGTNVCLHPFVSLQFARLGVLSMDGCCKVFDEAANGYVRSEAIAVLFLQKLKNAKRSYAQVVHAKTNCDGYKEQGITYPSGEAQTALLTEFYEECRIKPSNLSYLEAHGTGTVVGDPEECSAIDAVLTKNRKVPLLIGSVKSNIGHSEPSSGVSAMIKCILAFETGFIPPNINYNTPRNDLKGIIEGRMKVVTNKMPFEDNRGLAALSSFGFGGGNSHVLLHWNPKQKINGGLPKDNLPRLVCVSGRTEEAVTILLDELRDNGLDVEHIHLLYNIFRKNVQNHIYRGYTIVSKSGEIIRSLRYFSGDKKPLYFVFGEINNWCEIGNSLMVLPAFAASIQRTQKLLLDKDINLSSILLNKTHDNNTYVLGAVAVLVGIIDILNLLEIRPTDCTGFSFGVLAAAYGIGSLTVEETVRCAIVANKFLLSKSKEDFIIQENRPVNGNHITNGDIISNGNDANLGNLRKTLKTRNANYKQTHLSEDLAIVLDNEQVHRDKTLRGKFRSADYLADAIMNNVSKESKKINKRSVVYKISGGRTHEDINVISFATAKGKNYLTEFLRSLGSLYEYGYNPKIEKLYPTIDLPVSRGTRMISPYIKWNHKREWYIPNFYHDFDRSDCFGSATYDVPTTELAWSFITGHVVNGRNLFPAIGYLYLVWDTVASIHDLSLVLTKVTFEDCKFIRATTIPNKATLQFKVTILNDGKFEVVESDSVVVTGRVSYRYNELEGVTSFEPTGLSNTVALPLKQKDVYKELRLRGYNYRGEFRSIQECDSTASVASIKWNNNWISFMDNMLQMKILQFDTRLLYVPTYIAKLSIDPIKHTQFIIDNYGSEDKTPNVQVFNDQSTGTISSGYIKIWGLIASSIARRKYLGTPVLEAYKFIPNITNLETPVSIRVIMQIILENTLAYKIKIVELIDDHSENGSILTPTILTVLEDQPLIQSSVKILSKIPLDVGIEVEDKPLQNEIDCSLVIGTNILGRPEILKDASQALKEKGFIISRESRDFSITATNNFNIEVITVHRTATDSLVLFQKRSLLRKSGTLLVSSSNDFSWIDKLKEAIEKRINDNIIIYSENEPNSGILGLVNCLRREPTGTNVRCIFIMDADKKFVQNEPLFADQLQKNMAVNVYQNGQWGTYRHVLLDKLDDVESEHCFANVMVRGDLSSLRWIEGPLRHDNFLTPGNKLAHIYYAALNFRDVMTALGKIDVDVISQDRREQECVQGLEFSGKDESGNRIMGIVNTGALSTLLLIDPNLTFKVPDAWSLEEAATVPVVYLTVIYAFHVRGQMKQGESILIHSGTGGIGLAAIQLALHHGCVVFTTVGTQAKRDFLKETFPQLHDDHIGNSRDESFEQMIFKGTNGRGVDLVLNSLAGDKLLASVRCLATGGRFLEIGKFDLASNSELNILLLKKYASFQGVMLDLLFKETPQNKMILSKFLNQCIMSGAIKPLKRTIFKFDEVEQAFRFMATGKHMGKVLIEIRNPEKDIVSLASVQKFHCIPRYWCHPEMVYIIAGGLGGFGLELADWLILRGATKLVLTSRKGISTGYQNYRIRIWKSYGIIVNISKSNITTKPGCQELIEESQKLGPINAIFNLAVSLNDAVFENQTPESFCTSFGPKASATQYLDELTRILCPNLRQFVVFSSVSCGRGNAGQTNYGMANSVMERICENRKRGGFPALAIEWGAVGDVGLVAEMQEEHTELSIGGTLQQQISNCLKVLDGLLKQNEEVIVSSIVVAEKQTGAGAANNIVDAVINIIGIDAKSVSPHSSLAELGMDSMTAAEIKQTLERDFDVILSAKDMRTMTLARLKEIQTEKEANDQEVTTVNYTEFELDTIMRLIGSESDSRFLHKRLKSKIEESASAPNLILFPGIEGFSTVYESLASQINAHAICVQYSYYNTTNDATLAYTVESLLPIVEKYVTKKEPFTFIAYSYGVLVAMEIASLLETKGYTGTIICLDGAPALLNEMSKILNAFSDDDLQCAIIYQIVSILTSKDVILNYKAKIYNCKTWDERIDVLIEISKEFPQLFSENYQRQLAEGFYRRIKDLISYTSSYEKLKSKGKLYKAASSIQGLQEDYGLSNFFENPVEVQTFEGNHVTLLDNESLVGTINAFISEEQ